MIDIAVTGEIQRLTVGLSPGVRQTVKTLPTVRWNLIVQRTDFVAS